MKTGSQLFDRLEPIIPEKREGLFNTSIFGQEIRYFQSIPTTQSIAHQWAKQGAKEGSIVIAEEQTAGKGRLGNRWLSPLYQGIWMSIILRPPIQINEASQMTILSSLAVSRAIASATSLPVQIKWPNDLLIRGKKVCGILTEIRGKHDRVDYAVVGVGINVNLSNDSGSIEKPFTSLAAEWGKPIDRTRLLATILKVWERWYQRYRQEGFQVIKQNWELHVKLMGKTITARTPNGKMIGIVQGINQQGALLLKTEQGLTEVYSAEIED
jgi:BirA family biotin operon repressor/biotin-[acetyl-CoA-carboxylase] ligase